MFNLLTQEYDNLCKSLKNVDLAPDGIESIAYNLHQIIRTTTYIQSPQWLKSKLCTINPQSKNDNKCFQHAIIIPLYQQQINKNPERMSRSSLLINNLNWNNIKFSPKQEDFKKFEINKSIALSIFILHTTLKILNTFTSQSLILQENSK